jgi:hypothetical protein
MRIVSSEPVWICRSNQQENASDPFRKGHPTDSFPFVGLSRGWSFPPHGISPELRASAGAGCQRLAKALFRGGLEPLFSVPQTKCSQSHRIRSTEESQ